MKLWLRRLRGMLGIGAVWGTVGTLSQIVPAALAAMGSYATLAAGSTAGTVALARRAPEALLPAPENDLLSGATHAPAPSE